MNEAFAFGFLDELEKLAVTEQWISRKLGQDPKKFRIKKTRPFFEKARKLSGGDNLQGLQGLTTRTAKRQVMVRREAPKTRGGHKLNKERRETIAHELFHQKSPIGGKLETPAHIYGAFKSKGSLKQRIKKAVSRGAQGLKADAKTAVQTFVPRPLLESAGRFARQARERRSLKGVR